MTPSSPMGIGTFGGSFDPIHIGHLWIGEAALDQLPIDHVRWFPAKKNPLKPRPPIASDEQRLQMLRLALSGQSGHVVDPWELQRDQDSYTIDTLEYLEKAFPERPRYLIIGADSLASFPRWHRPDLILQKCTLAVVARGGLNSVDYRVLGSICDANQLQRCQQAQLRMSVIELSSQQLRDDLRSGRSIRFRVPHPVRSFIKNERLYHQ